MTRFAASESPNLWSSLSLTGGIIFFGIIKHIPSDSMIRMVSIKPSIGSHSINPFDRAVYMSIVSDNLALSHVLTACNSGKGSLPLLCYISKRLLSQRIRTLLLCMFLQICCACAELFLFALLPITIYRREFISPTFAHAEASLRHIFHCLPVLDIL